MKRNILLILCITVVFCSCQKENDDTAKSIRPGCFRLTQLQRSDLKSATVNKEDSASTCFNLGDVKASRECFFILSNAGNAPIFDITLSTNNTAFEITPCQIPYLTGKGDTTESFIPILTLGILHGTQLNGVGYCDLLPMGTNTATLTVTGKTLDNRDTIILASTFDFSVTARIMDVRLFDNNTEIDLTAPPFSISTNLGGLGFLRVYQVHSTGISVKNSGNVNISLQTYNYSEYYTKLRSLEIPPDSTKNITLHDQFTYLELCSNGTITDDNRIQLGNNGKGYMCIAQADYQSPVIKMTHQNNKMIFHLLALIVPGVASLFPVASEAQIAIVGGVNCCYAGMIIF